jgi:phage baseplate assembly protein W
VSADTTGNVAFPRHFDRRGRTAEVDHDRYVRQLIEQVLFTAPGERVNRPTFGSGLTQLLFAPVDVSVGAAAQLTAQTALQSWLGDRSELLDLAVRVDDTRLEVTVSYVVRRTGTPSSDTFVAGV